MTMKKTEHKTSIVFLGPPGATFSYDAYEKLCQKFKGVPTLEDKNSQLISVENNSLILPALLKQKKAYGVIAMETKAEGRVSEPLESFIDLLSLSSFSNKHNPLVVMSAGKMILHFCLMVRKGLKTKDIKGILGHQKALGACKNHIEKMKCKTEATSSNGKAAEEVAFNEVYKEYAALGPKSAAKKYNLEILQETFEDHNAQTTFFLLGPSTEKSRIGEVNRALIVFRVKDLPGALVHTLVPFMEEKINLIQIHSVHVKDGKYDFALEVECSKKEIEQFNRAVKRFLAYTEKSYTFGPFEVVSI